MKSTNGLNQNPPVESGVQRLAQRGLGLPLHALASPLASEWVEFMSALAADKLHKRSCRRCRRSLMVPPKGGPDFARFWGSTRPAITEYICVGCYNSHHSNGPTSPMALALKQLQVATPADTVERVEPPTIPAALDPPGPNWYDQAKGLPQLTPSDRTVRFVALLIARTDGWLDLEALVDLMAGAKIVAVKNGEKRRFDQETLAELPAGGDELTSAQSHAQITVLLTAAVDSLERSNSIYCDETGNLYRSKSVSHFGRTAAGRSPSPAVEPLPAGASAGPLVDLDQQTLLTYRTALAKVLAKHPEQGGNRWAARVLTMAQIFPAEEWQETYFDLCWREFERVRATKTA